MRELHGMVQELKRWFWGIVKVAAILRAGVDTRTEPAQTTVMTFICPLMSLSLPAMLPPRKGLPL